MVCESHGPGGFGSSANAAQRLAKNLRLQRDEIRGRQYGGGKWHDSERAAHYTERQSTGPRSLDGNHYGCSRPDAERRHDGASLSHFVGSLSHHLRNQGLLVPHPRGLGYHGRLSRFDVHATRSHLDHGNDAEATSFQIADASPTPASAGCMASPVTIECLQARIHDTLKKSRGGADFLPGDDEHDDGEN